MTAANADPLELLLVHGAWHGSWVFDELRLRLDAAGLRSRTVDLPSAGSTASVDEDVQVVRDALAAREVPTLVVAHSYGGIVATAAAAGVDHVRALVYLCAFLLDVGESLLDVLQHQVPDWIAIDEQAGTSMPLTPIEVFYADCDPAIAEAAAARLVPQSLASFGAPLTAAAWREVPSTYLICEEDQAIPAAAQEAMSARAGAVKRLSTSHSPFLSAPDAVVALIASAAAEAREDAHAGVEGPVPIAHPG